MTAANRVVARQGVSLGIDVGTSGLKLLALTSQGEVCAVARAEYSELRRPTTAQEQDPRVWIDALSAALERMASSIDLESVTVVGLSGQTHGLVITDPAGDLLAPCQTWADARCVAEAAELGSTIGPAVAVRCANPIEPAFTAPKMLWAAHHERTAVAQGRLLLPKDYVRWTLTGDWATDPSDAASTLLFDLRQQTWVKSFIEATGWHLVQMPAVLPSAAIAGHVTVSAASTTGLAPGTPVVTGGSDVACAALGAGLVDPGATYLNLGTAAQLLTVVPEPDATRGAHYIFGHCVPGSYLAMGSLHAAGLSLKWFVGQFGRPGSSISDTPYRDLDQVAATVPPGSMDVLFLPDLVSVGASASSNPGGAFVGLTPQHGWAECGRAVLEGVAFGIKSVHEAMGRSSADVLLFGGGGASSSLWPQVFADTFGLPVHTLQHESSPLGAAMLGGLGIGFFDDAHDAVTRCVRVGAIFNPDPPTIDLYGSAYERFVCARDALACAAKTSPGPQGANTGSERKR